MNFSEYQKEALKTEQAAPNELASLMVPLLGLAGETGSLLSEYKKWLREGNRYRPFTDQVSEEIGDILWYLANIASKVNLDLDEVAQENLAKLTDRYRSKTDEQPLFPRAYDSQFPAKEQLPNKFRVTFREKRTPKGMMLEICCQGKQLGNLLTDNAHHDDGYRFHDVFHFTNAVVLGWSPVTRDLFDVKRRSDLRIDEVEDGARAAVTEEAISAIIFGHAKDFSYFEGAQAVEFGLLRTIQLMTRPFEVRNRSARDWERAILAGYQVWRQMYKNRGGVFVGDSTTGVVRYERLRMRSNPRATNRS